MSEGTSSDSDREERNREASGGFGGGGDQKKGVLVTVDGERPELELESLLKASAYVLGASGESIVYKALLEDGTAMAVRRIGKSQGERMREFESHVRSVAKLRHPNLVRVRGFYWGEDEKLVVCDYVSNGSLAGTGSSELSSSLLSLCVFSLFPSTEFAAYVSRVLWFCAKMRCVVFVHVSDVFFF